MNNSNASVISFGDRRFKEDWYYRLNHKLSETLTHYC